MSNVSIVEWKCPDFRHVDTHSCIDKGTTLGSEKSFQFINVLRTLNSQNQRKLEFIKQIKKAKYALNVVKIKNICKIGLQILFLWCVFRIKFWSENWNIAAVVFSLRSINKSNDVRGFPLLINAVHMREIHGKIKTSQSTWQQVWIGRFKKRQIIYKFR